MRKGKTKMKKKLKRLSAIALAFAVCAGNFSGMTVQAESTENVTKEASVIVQEELEQAGSVGEIVDNEIYITAEGFYVGRDGVPNPDPDIKIDKSIINSDQKTIWIEGVPENGTITLGDIPYRIDSEGKIDGFNIIVTTSCTIDVEGDVQLYGGSVPCIEVRNGATVTLVGKGDIYVKQEGVEAIFKGDGNANFCIDNYTGRFNVLGDSDCVAAFSGFENIDIDSDAPYVPNATPEAVFSIDLDGKGMLFKNCGNIKLESNNWEFACKSEGTWIDATGNVEIKGGLNLWNHGYLAEEPMIKAKNFTLEGSLTIGGAGSYFFSYGETIKADEKIRITNGYVDINGQMVAKEIELIDTMGVDVSTVNCSPFEGDVEIRSEGEVKVCNTIVDMEGHPEQLAPLFDGNVEISTNGPVFLEGVYPNEADLFTGEKNISYGDGYLRVRTMEIINEESYFTERVEGNFVWDRYNNPLCYNRENRLILEADTLWTVTKNDLTSQFAEVDVTLQGEEKLSDVLQMAEGTEVLNYGYFDVDAPSVENVDCTIDLHPESTRYIKLSDANGEEHMCIYTADIAWDSENSKKATWKYISKDQDRVSEVQLYKDGNLCQLDGADSVIVSTNEFDFTSYIEKEGYGKYTFKVKPVLTEDDEDDFSFVTESAVYTYQAGNTGENDNNGSQGDNNGSQENNNGSQGDNNVPQGDNNGSQGDNNEPQGDNNGSQGDNNGPQGDNNGFQGNNNGPQGDNNGNQGEPQPQEPDVNDDEEDEIEEGTELEYEDAIYVVTKIGDHPTVSYQETLDNKAKTIKIPSTIKVEGVTYKVTGIEDNAFANNKKITKVTIGNKVKTIGESAFSGCKNLKTVNMSSELTTIDEEAFYRCTSLTSITIPSKVNKIGTKAFYGCKKLKNITIKTKKLTNKNVGKKAFQGIVKKATIKVPSSKLSSYKKLLKSKGVSKSAKIKK